MPELEKKNVCVVDQSNESARSLMMKLAKSAKPGAVIYVTEDEFEVLRTGVIQIDT